WHLARPTLRNPEDFWRFLALNGCLHSLRIMERFIRYPEPINYGNRIWLYRMLAHEHESPTPETATRQIEIQVLIVLQFGRNFNFFNRISQLPHNLFLETLELF